MKQNMIHKYLLYVLFITYALINYVVELNRDLDAFARYVHFALDGGIILLALGMARRGNVFRVYFWGFFLVSSLSLVLGPSPGGILSHLNGLREPLVFLSALVIMAALMDAPSQDEFVRSFSRLLVFFSLLQIPIAFSQYYEHGASDFVGGSLSRGGSGVLTQSLFLIAFFLVRRYAIDPKTGRLMYTRFLIISLLLIPCFINETKITIILIGPYYLLHVDVKKAKVSAIIIALGGALGLLLFFTVYKDILRVDPTQFFQKKFLTWYLFNQNVNATDISRFTKIFLIIQSGIHDVTKMLFGFGYGLMKGQNILGTAQETNTMKHLFKGSRPFLFNTLLQGGIAYTVFMLMAAFSFLRKRATPSTADTSRVRLFLLVVIGTMWFYNDAIYFATFAITISFLFAWVLLAAPRPSESAEVAN